MRSLIDARSKVLLIKTIGKFIKMLSNYLIKRGKAFKLAKYLSGRRFNTRIWEHFRSVIKCNTDGAMGAHYKKHHPNENIPDLPFTCKLIRKSYDFVDRKNWQTKEIDIRQPSVNVQLMATKEHNLPWNFS